MSDPYPPSEFGGKTNALGIQPFPHPPDVNEKLRAIYVTGDADETGTLAPQPGREAFQGLLTEAEQTDIAESQGLLDKGQIWEEMEQGGP